MEARREEIIAEAIRLIGERGHYGFTVPELAKRCGLTNGGLLYHFGSKEQLLLEVLKERVRRETDRLTGMVAPEMRDPVSRGTSLEPVFKILFLHRLGRA